MKRTRNPKPTRSVLSIRSRRLPTGEIIASIRRALLSWFDREGRDFPWRRSHATRYMQILSEVLLQRTRAETVSGFLRSFIEEFPSWRKLAEARPRELGKWLRPLGLWRRRSSTLRDLSRALVERRGIWPADRASIEELPGVGQYVASAVLLFVHGEPEPLLDVNMARVIERVFGARTFADIRDDPWLQHLSRRLVRSRRAAEVNWAILDLAAVACRSRSPCCNICPLMHACRYPKKTYMPS